MLQLRTIEQAIAIIKSQDNDSSLTKHALRQLIIQKKIPSVKVGSKYLVNMVVLETFLQGSIESQQPQDIGIRRLSEKSGNPE